MVRNVTKTEAFGTGFAAAFSVSGLQGSGMTAAAMWRPTTAAVNAAAVNAAAVNAAAVNAAAVNAAAVNAAANPAQHQTVALSPDVRMHSTKPAALHTQIKQYVVTTPDAGRGNKGTSPWGFPV